MTQYIEVAVNVPQVSGTYHYHLPPDLEESRQEAWWWCPLGGRPSKGLHCASLKEHPQVIETKAMQELVDPQPVLSSAQLELASWMAENTLAPLAACLGIMVPPGLTPGSRSTRPNRVTSPGHTFD